MISKLSKERSRNYLRQLKGAILYRAIAVIASFLAIPIMIRYLGQEQFGVWSTLLTVMSWIIFFDLGVGNGLRNKVAESLAKEQINEAASYVGSAYTLIGIIALGLWAVLTFGSYFVPWQTVFNTDSISNSTIRETVQIAVFFIILNFWIGLIAALLGAVQQTALIALGQLISNLLVLGLLFFLSRMTDASISNLAFVYGLSIVVANVLLSVKFYRARPELRPRTCLNKRHVVPLLTVGLQFFLIQLASLVIFTTDKMLITQLFGPKYVTQYEVVFKLFSLVGFAHGLISAPLWSAYTDAYHRGDISWVRKMLVRQLLIFFAVLICVLILVAFSNELLDLWLGSDLGAPVSLVWALALLATVSVWNNIFGFVLGGLGKVRLGSIYTCFTAVLNIPVSYFFSINMGFGLSGIVYGTVASIAISSILSPVQVFYFIFFEGKSRALDLIFR